MTCPIGTDIEAAAQLLQAGKLVAFPTETVYGLGGHALQPNAVARIFEAKDRPHFDPLIVHVAKAEDVQSLIAGDISPLAQTLMQHFWPGPLTLVFPKSEIVPDLVTSGLPSVAVRIPDHPVAQELLQRVAGPVAAPSANPFGQLSPTSASHVENQLGNKVDYIVDGGPCRVGVESTVLQLPESTDDSNAMPRLLRFGGVTAEEIKNVVGEIEIPSEKQHPVAVAQPAPGMLPKHYAPRTQLVLTSDEPQSAAGQRIGRLFFDQAQADEFAGAADVVEVLSPGSDLVEAASRFFATLRQLDDANVDLIVAYPFPEEGLGRALNDRLRRAAR